MSNVEKAGQILDRVKIMRVFDFAGLVEGIEEMKVELEKLSLRLRSSVQEDEGREDEGRGEVGEMKVLQRIKSTIADSQGDDDDEEVDMLDDLPGQALPPFTTTVGDEDNHDKSCAAGERNKRQSHDAPNQEQKIRHNMLIITNLTTVMAPLTKNNYVQGKSRSTVAKRNALKQLTKQFRPSSSDQLLAFASSHGSPTQHLCPRTQLDVDVPR